MSTITSSDDSQKIKFGYIVEGVNIETTYNQPTENSNITFPSGINILATEGQLDALSEAKLDVLPISTSDTYYGGDRLLHTLPVIPELEPIPLADPITAGIMKLYTSEDINIDGTIDQKTISDSFSAIRTDLMAIPGISGLTSEKLLNQIEILKSGVIYGFNDWSTYIPANANTIPSSGTITGTLKLRNSSAITGAFLPTGKIIDTGVYSVTITGKPTVNNNLYFGIGVKNGTSFGGAMYNGSTGAVSMMNYNSSSFVSGGGIGTNALYNVNDIVSVRIIFRGSSTYLQTAVNGVWSIEAPAPTAMKILHGGELVICLRGSTTVDNITVKIEDAADFSNEVFVSTSGSDINNGTYDFPLATINAAKQLTKGRGWITIMGGDYLINSTSPNANFNLIGGTKIRGARGSNVRFIYGTRITSAILEPTYTKVYSVPYTITLTSTNTLWQHDVLDPATLILQNESHPLHRGATNRLTSMKMTWLPSLAALEASSSTRAYFYWSANVLYFTMTNGSNLTSNPIVIPSNTAVTVGGGMDDTKISNIKFLYNGGMNCSGSFEIMDSSLLFGSGVYGWGYGASIGGIFRRCEAGGVNYSGGGDGFNSSISTVVSLNKYSSTTLYDCWSHDNGDDGDSIHNNAESVSYGALYEYNTGSGITAASGGHMSLYHSHIRRNGAAGLASTGSAADGGNSTNLYCNGVISANNIGGNGGSTNTSWTSCTLINCVSVGGAFTGTTGKYNCIDIP